MVSADILHQSVSFKGRHSMSRECGFAAVILAMAAVTGDQIIVIGGGDLKHFLQVHKGAFAILAHT